MDYIRHPGILNDIAGNAWNYIGADEIDENTYEMPDIDALFNNVNKIIVFGEKYENNNARGVHNIHQNQADLDSQYSGNNAPYQDGAVIFVYNDGTRKILMKSFGPLSNLSNPNAPYQGQSDFSYTTDPDGTGPLKAGQAAPFTEQNIFYDQYVSGYENGAVYGPYTAEQFEVHANSWIQNDCVSYTDVDIYLGHDATVSDTNYDAFSRINGCHEEFIRSYSPNRNLPQSQQNTYYFYVKPWGYGNYAQIRVKYR